MGITEKDVVLEIRSISKEKSQVIEMDDIRNYYGSTKVQTDSRVLLEA